MEPRPVTGMPRLYILLGVVALVLLQTLMAYLLIPAPGQAATGAATGINQHVEEEGTQFNFERWRPQDMTRGGRVIDTVEQQLDQFQVTEVHGAEAHGVDSTLTIYRFRFALVFDRRQESAFRQEFDARRAQIQAAILLILRESSERERNDPKLLEIIAKIERNVDAIMGGRGLVLRAVLTDFDRDVI